MVDVASPPRYTRYSRVGPVPTFGGDLPAYSHRNTLAALLQPPREPTEHVFQLSGSNGAWATLKVYSSAKSAKSLPTFYEKEKVNGCVKLNLERGDSISSVTVKVTGRLITGANQDGNVTFLDITEPIWGKASAASSRTSSPADGSGKLSTGRHRLPFSIVLPRTINVPVKSGETRECSLPETFLEHHGVATIQYDLMVVISRGKLRADSHIKTAFGYVPSSRPEAPSILRQYSYSHHLPLSGPDSDPQGWHTLPPINVRGMMKTSPVDVNCLFSIAKPLCYTRGSVIPCMMSLEGNNTAALDAMSAPGSIVVTLQRHVRYNTRRTKEKATVEEIASGIWWPTASQASQNSSRSCFMEGEIQLSKDLRSSSDVGSFSVSYFVVLSSFDSLGITPYDPTPLAIVPVSIATMHCKGPRPQNYAPPAYPTSTVPDPFDPRLQRCPGLNAMMRGFV